VIRPVRSRLAALLLLGAVGCLPRQHAAAATKAPTAASEWPIVYAQAQAEARDTHPGIADRVLTDFAQRFPDTPESAEVSYWRAVFKLDPNNAASIRDAIALLDSYLANTPNGLHRAEALAMRRTASALETRTAALAAQLATPVPKIDERAHEEELTRLRDELGKANAELARIKRRLARPKP
jgi:hypothetical protein